MSAPREVLIGRNSKVWRAVSANPRVAARFAWTIGHSDLEDFGFTPADRVWVFSYSRIPAENESLLIRLREADVREVVYVSTASAIVTRLTGCYEYPRVKLAAETAARRLLDARILTLGIVAAAVEELPAGRNAATLHGMLADFMLAPQWPDEGGTRMNLFELVDVPFRGGWEAALQRFYDRLQWSVRRWPCVLRPFDLVLRMLGIRWYGYVNLGNRLWTTTTS